MTPAVPPTAARAAASSIVPLTGVIRDYPWGSTTRIPQFLGERADARPWAELWFGAHASGPSPVSRPPGSPGSPGSAGSAGSAGEELRTHIATDPGRILGPDVTARFGHELPYLLKLIAPASPLSLQVHPNLDQARIGYQRRQAAYGPEDYVDANHKPELVYALSTFEALCGFRAPRRAAELFEGLDHPLARDIVTMLRHRQPKDGVEAAFHTVLTKFTATDVEQVRAECAARLAAGTSPSRRSDAIVVRLGKHFPGDPGVVAALLLNPVTLNPGEVMFVPAGAVHAYLDGFGVEVMASSDNVLRAGLTPKNIDIPEVLAIVDYTAAPPIRLAPETFGPHVRTYYAPVDDFELSVIEPAGTSVQVPGRGPRILLAIDGQVGVHSGCAREPVHQGQAVFIPADHGRLTLDGAGVVVQADVP